MARISAHDAEQLLPSLIAAAEASPKPAVICSWAARNLTERSHELLRDSALPVYETSDEGIDALAGLIRWHHDTGHVVPTDRASAVAAERPAGTGTLDEHQSKQLLTDAGIPFADEVLVTSAAEAADAISRFGGDAVIKLVASGLVHKTELGLVRVGVEADEAAAVIAEFDATAAANDLDQQGYLVSRRHHGVEMIVGATMHPTFGPVAMVGTGGVLAEHERDVRFLSAPATEAEIDEALRSLRSWPVLDGLRGARPDVAALAEIVASLSDYVDTGRDWLESVDLNPVIVSDSGAVAVDATVIVSQGAER